MVSSVLAYSHHSHNGLAHVIAGWVARAVTWRLVGRLPFWALLVVGAVAFLVYAKTRRS